MGSSGSGAGGGSGGFGGGGGGGGGGSGGGSGAGYVTLRGGTLTSVDTDKQTAWSAIQQVFSKLKQDYLGFVIGEPGVVAAYEALHRLHVLLVQERSWVKVQETFGVDDQPGCLLRLADALVADEGPHAVNPALQAPLKAALNDFLLRVVGDNPTVRDRGEAAEVMRRIQAQAFQRTSNSFLGAYLFECLRLEGKNLSASARKHLREFTAAKSDQIVAAFERQYRGKAWRNLPQASYPHLFRVMQGEPAWTATRLRRMLKP